MAAPDTSSSFSPDIVVACPKWSESVDDPEALCSKAAAAALYAANDAPASVTLSVLLTDDEEITALNSQFRGKDNATNVLSFPAGDVYPDGSVMLGDIAVAYQTVASEAQTGGIDIAAHLTHMIVHGTLHLLGYDHETDDEAEEMEALESRVLGGLGVADPYAESGS